MNTQLFPSTRLALLSTVLAALTVGAIAIAQAKPSIEDRAFSCGGGNPCVYFSDLFAKSAAFRQSLQTAASRSRVRIDAHVYDGPSTPMQPIRLGDQMALVGSTCEAHNCPHSLRVLHYRSLPRTVGLYVDRSGRSHDIGAPSRPERAVLARH